MEWISVKDRLPDNDEDVLVTDGYDFMVAWFSHDFWHFGGESLWEHKYVTHWMPLPDSPNK